MKKRDNIIKELHQATFTSDIQSTVTPDIALKLLEYGNDQFLKNGGIKRKYAEQIKVTTGGQWPHSVVLSCIDSRVPTEIVFNQGIGDVFNAKVAGNIANEDILGSIEYGCQVAGSKLVVVMGHTGCGAVKAACDHVQLGNITTLLGKIMPAVISTPSDSSGVRSSKNPAFANAVAVTNVKLTIQQMRNESWILGGLERSGAIKIVGAMYYVDSGRVDFMDYDPPIV